MRFYMLLCCCGGLLLHGCEPCTPTLKMKIGQMIMIGFRGTSLTPYSPVSQQIRRYHIGGVVLYEYDSPTATRPRNIESPEQLQALNTVLQELSPTPLLIGIDEEGGKVSRLKRRYGFPPTVSAQYLGEVDDTAVTAAWATQTAKLLEEMRINLNFAPVVDLNINPDSPAIGHYERSFSADPEKVYMHASAVIEEHHRRDRLCTLKHFPGHGSATADSHLGLVDVTETWSEQELQPYADLIAADKVDLIMTAHVFNRNLDPEYPATLSQSILTGILREQLAYDGVVISDDMQMGAIVDHYSLETAIEKAVNAGVDILVFSNNGRGVDGYDENIGATVCELLLEMVQDGRISEERIDASYQRIMQLKSRLNRF